MTLVSFFDIFTGFRFQKNLKSLPIQFLSHPCPRRSMGSSHLLGGGGPWKIKSLREGGNQRNVQRDLKSGIVTIEIIDDFGKRMDQEHGLITG